MFEAIATFCSGTFFGAAVYISLVQHPASLEAGGVVPGMFFPPMYRRAAPMQIGLAVAGAAAGLIQWHVSGNVLWLVGGFFLVSVIPITLMVIKPINDILLAPDHEPGSEKTIELLRRWGPRHWVRSVVSGLSFLTYLAALVFGSGVA